VSHVETRPFLSFLSLLLFSVLYCTRVCVFSFSLWGRVTGFMFARAHFRTLSLGLCGKKLLVLLCPPASGRGERLD